MNVRDFLRLYVSAALLGGLAFWPAACASNDFASKAGRGGAGVHNGSGLHGTEEPLEARAPKALSQPVNTAPHTAGKPAATVGTSGLVRSSSPFQLSGRDWGAGMASAQGDLSEGRPVLSGRADQKPDPQPEVHAIASTRGVSGGASLRVLATNAAHLCGVEPALFHRQIARESGWNPRARSSSGALGLGQLMPAAAREMGVTDRLDPWQNLLGSACYLRRQFDRFGSWRKALHAYHAGPNRRTTVKATHDYATDIIEGAN